MRVKRTTVVPHRRRREGKTDYRLRLGLLKSGKPRLVVRKSLNRMNCQIVVYANGGDSTLASASSSELAAFGWSGHGGNIPSSYLTGMLCAKRAVEKGIKDAVLDTGLYRSTAGSRIYAALKGAVDAGLSMALSSDTLPSDDRISGSHTKVGGKGFDEAKKMIEASESKPASRSAARPKQTAKAKKPAKAAK